ncbi:phosphoenolpyruvate--protein phosphotransferase [Rhodospirillum rubrum]|uniref:phosphoenolpyruvate--protein phosphotransferase n=1 Tax=Rhodospirillum rubrum TaxID=1085 RepID=UPI001907AE17|nr:phosphoenolpyruvate--protein phosphotransferase [Rhodospirillum rubrum]MBK1666212.1 phosphoenolpyruvate--protein phosphotransferase [Rhodospirillum rubrum]MBK1678343.1 phosphoenolpyruvate--protein phosphotransferase [Rhodospirillum rubrum]
MGSVDTVGALPRDLVRLAVSPRDKADAIAQAAQMLVAAGCVEAGYAQSMIRREGVANTFLGHGVAIPHGMAEDRALVRANGIAVLQVPDGVEWNPGQSARLVVAIAAQSDTHIAILRRLTRLLQDEDRLGGLFVTSDPGDVITALTTDPEVNAPAVPVSDLAKRFEWVLDYPNGLHARPAARWVDTAKGYAARCQIRHGDEVADVKNLVALLRLGLTQGERISVSAEGPDADQALSRLKATMLELSVQERADAALAARRAKQPVIGWHPPGAPMALAGIAAAPGLAIGRLHVLAAADRSVPDHPVPLSEGGNILHEALSATRLQLKALADDTARRLGPSEAGIFKAQGELLNDTDLITLTCQLMVEGHGVAWSWDQAIERMAGKLAALGNALLVARAADLRDVGRRVLGQLDPGLGGASLHDLPDEPCILIAGDLAPSETAGLDPSRVVGLATAQGGPTAHTAILARTMGLPAMVAAGPGLLAFESGTLAILDGYGGRLYPDPSPEALSSARAFIAEQDLRRAREEERRSLPASTRDGHRVEIAANVNFADQAAFALSQGAEGVGLMRTEFLFLERGDTPDEEAQLAAYTAMQDALNGRPLIVRALDIGGDKQVAHLDLPREDNPFLGVRGARLLLRRPDLLDPQLRALYRAAKSGKPLSIMFPMITSVPEIIALRGICERIRAEVEGPEVALGIMVEVPAAALAADVLARHADFFSIGTNDLTQYTLAIDRQNPELAAEADSLHPAVLRLIRMTVDGAAAHGRWVGICGGIAGDPFGAALLTGLGVQELSMTPRDIPAVKERLRDCDATALRALAERALTCETAADVRALEADL